MARSDTTEFLELLGEGTQGRVFKALRVDRQTGLSHTVAIKILHSETAVELWQKEFQSLARVRSPYCVQVLSFERINGRPALVLEFVDGLSVAELARAAILNNTDIGEVLAQIEAGLRDLRRQGSCHGDLSPANVMVDTDGRVRLLDFGLANGRRATPEFSAPERLAGHPADFAADLFSLGRIEEFLRRERLENSWLALDPPRRTAREITPDPDQQTHVGAKIKDLLERRRQAGTFKTQSLVQITPIQKRSLGRMERFVIMAGACAFLGASGATPPHHAPRIGQLAISTEAWFTVTVDGVDLGYAPLRTTVREGIHTIGYRSANKSGKLAVDVHAGETLRLSDRDFAR